MVPPTKYQQKCTNSVAVHAKILLTFCDVPTEYLEWIQLTDQVELPESDDGITGPILIAIPGFPFWDSVQTQVFVSIPEPLLKLIVHSYILKTDWDQWTNILWNWLQQFLQPRLPGQLLHQHPLPGGPILGRRRHQGWKWGHLLPDLPNWRRD